MGQATLKGRKLRRRAAQPERRPNANQRGYDSRWRKASYAYLLEPGNALCRRCLQDGVYTASTCVDHITPHTGHHELFWDESNWQPLCHSCHSRKTATEDGGYGNRRAPRPRPQSEGGPEVSNSAAKPH